VAGVPDQYAVLPLSGTTSLLLAICTSPGTQSDVADVPAEFAGEVGLTEDEVRA